MIDYIDDASQAVVAASDVLIGGARYLSGACNPKLPVGTVLREQGSPDSPRLRIIAVSTQTGEGAWLTPVEAVMQEYRIKYSFITITHSTIAGSMPQQAATKAEALSQARAWLVQIYQPVEFDFVAIEEP